MMPLESFSVLLLPGGGVPEGGGGSDIYSIVFHYFVFPTTPPVGHPSSPEEGN